MEDGKIHTFRKRICVKTQGNWPVFELGAPIPLFVSITAAPRVRPFSLKIDRIWTKYFEF